MSDRPAEPRRIEIDYDELRRILQQGDNRKTVKDAVTNKFDRSHAAYQERELRSEVYQQRGLNVQQHAIMQGFSKWQGTMHQMAYNLSLGLSISLGGIDEAVRSMRGQSWWDKNAPLVIILVVGMAAYFGFVYSPDFRASITALFEPLSTKIILAVTLIVILILYTRQRRRGRPQ